MGRSDCKSGTIECVFVFCLVVLLLHLPCLSHADQGGVFRLGPAVSPSAGPPLKYGESRRVTVVFQTTPEAIRKLVPSPLVPGPGNTAILMAAHWNAEGFRNREYNDGGGTFREIALVVPVRFGRKAGVYTVVLYLDSASRLPMSREIWGFPKKLADIAVEEREGRFAASVIIGGETAVRLDYERTGKVEPVPVLPPSDVFNLKMIPSVRRDAPPEVLQITAVKSNFRAKEAWRGKATLTLGTMPTEPLGDIPVLKIISAGDMTIDGTMDYGEVVHDFLAPGRK
jgi:acetoacetate decarboxylase